MNELVLSGGIASAMYSMMYNELFPKYLQYLRKNKIIVPAYLLDIGFKQWVSQSQNLE
jgi:hypothetical protein